jgi:hypothetical protein
MEELLERIVANQAMTVQTLERLTKAILELEARIQALEDES